MARLTVDEEVWQDILSVAVKLRVSKHLVSGPLFDLWHNSQRLKITHVDKDSFFDLCEIEEEDNDYKDKLFNHFIKKRFILEDEDGRYRIRGNQKHIDGIEAKRQNGRKGGRPKKPKEPDQKPNENQNADLGKQGKPSENQNDNLGLPLHNITLHSISNHSNPLHSNSNHGDADKPQVFLKPEELISLWNSKAPPNKQYNSHFFSTKHAKIFLETTGFPDFCRIEQWDKLLTLAFGCEWLAQEGPLALTWIIEHHNAIDVLSGKYSKSKKRNDNSTENTTDWDAIARSV